MIRTLRALFLGRLLREKVLVVGFMALGLAWWLSAFGSRAKAFSVQTRRTTAALKEQQVWLDNRKSVELAAQKSVSLLDPAKTKDATHLYSTVQAIATEAGFTRNTRQTPQPDSISGQFSVHTLVYTIQGIEGLAGWRALNKFYVALRDQSPYIAVEQFRVTVTGNTAQHTAVLRVSSVEITR